MGVFLLRGLALGQRHRERNRRLGAEGTPMKTDSDILITLGVYDLDAAGDVWKRLYNHHGEFKGRLWMGGIEGGASDYFTTDDERAIYGQFQAAWTAANTEEETNV